jgi:hypothetical protein
VEVEAAPPNRLLPVGTDLAASGALASVGFAPNNPPPVLVEAGAAAGSAGLVPPRLPKLNPPAFGASSFFPSSLSAGFAPIFPNKLPPALGASAAGAGADAAAGAPKENPVFGASALGAAAGSAGLGVVDAGVEPNEPNENPPDLGGSGAAGYKVSLGRLNRDRI